MSDRETVSGPSEQGERFLGSAALTSPGKQFTQTGGEIGKNRRIICYLRSPLPPSIDGLLKKCQVSCMIKLREQGCHQVREFGRARSVLGDNVPEYRDGLIQRRLRILASENAQQRDAQGSTTLPAAVGFIGWHRLNCHPQQTDRFL